MRAGGACRPGRTCLALVAAVGWLAAGCGTGADAGGSGAVPDGSAAGAVTVRLGYFPNVTHAAALVGIEQGLFVDALGADRLAPKPFNAGPEAVEALFAGAIDAAYIGPNPAANAFAKSGGKAVRVVAGATSGGAALVVQPGVSRPADLRGKKVASPQLGNSQDVALRTWLADHGMKTNKHGGGDVNVAPQANADTLTAFRAGLVTGAWVPEPWATRLVQEGGGKVLVDERELWPGGRFPTTNLVVRTEFLQRHPETVRRLLDGHLRATHLLGRDAWEGRRLTNDGIEKVTGRRLPDRVIEGSWQQLTFTVDPVAPSLGRSAEHAQALGLLEPVELDGLYDLRLLNDLMRASGTSEMAGL